MRTYGLAMADQRRFTVVLKGSISEDQYALLAHQAFLAAHAMGRTTGDFRAYLRQDGEQTDYELEGAWDEIRDQRPWDRTD